MLSGSASFQNDKWSQQNLTFKQTGFDDRVGVELVYDRQTYRRSSFVPFQNFSGIFVDLMQDYLGQQNPNLGRTFVMDRASMLTQSDQRESFRATGFYRIDSERFWSSSRLAKWIGKHTRIREIGCANNVWDVEHPTASGGGEWFYIVIELST